jgi:Flp pilus assembly protein TadG
MARSESKTRGERGNTLVTVAIFLMVLLPAVGLVVDVGMAYAQRRMMQNAADAGALAGGTELITGGQDAAIWAAIQQYVTANGADACEASYVPSGYAVGTGYRPPDAVGVSVMAEVTFATTFARFVGLNEIVVQATAEGGYAPLDIMLVMDRSGTMADDSTCSNQSHWCRSSQSYCVSFWCHGTWYVQPLLDAQTAASYFVDLNQPDLSQIGLVSYSYSATLDRMLTSNFASVKSAIYALTTGGCTNGADAMEKARLELIGPRSRAHAARIMVILTDGLPNYPHCYDCRSYCPWAKQAMRDQASLAADDNIVIYAIGLGSQADMGLVQDIADLTGGEAYFAPSSGDLQAIYEEVFQQVRLRLTG